jgi:hypothetical protein
MYVLCVVTHAHKHRISNSLTVRIIMTGLAYGSPLVRMPECTTQQAWGFNANPESQWQYMQETKRGNACHPVRQMGAESLCCLQV